MFLLRHPRPLGGAVKSLLLAGHRHENEGGVPFLFDITRASSSTAATPEASSFAPGASAVALSGSLTRES